MLTIKRNEVFYSEVSLNKCIIYHYETREAFDIYLFELSRSFPSLLFGYLFVGKRGNPRGFS